MWNTKQLDYWTNSEYLEVLRSNNIDDIKALYEKLAFDIKRVKSLINADRYYELFRNPLMRIHNKLVDLDDERKLREEILNSVLAIDDMLIPKIKSRKSRKK